MTKELENVLLDAKMLLEHGTTHMNGMSRIERLLAIHHAHPRWRHPQIELYPDTALGRRYRKMIERGLIPKGGRRAPYRE